MAFIRGYQDGDFDACAQICIATLPPSIASSPAAAKISPYIWTHPYTYLSPSTCHVLDDGNGNAVGYCIGCPNVNTFVSRYPLYESALLAPAIPKPDFTTRERWYEPTITNGENGSTEPAPKANPLALAQCAYRPDWVLLENRPAITSNWYATMHIDLLPPWQGRGWGRRLIDEFVKSVQESGEDYGEGEHIGISGENTKVVPFYERLGFRLIGTLHARSGNVWMVRDIEKVSEVDSDTLLT